MSTPASNLDSSTYSPQLHRTHPFPLWLTWPGRYLLFITAQKEMWRYCILYWESYVFDITLLFTQKQVPTEFLEALVTKMPPWVQWCTSVSFGALWRSPLILISFFPSNKTTDASHEVLQLLECLQPSSTLFAYLPTTLTKLESSLLHSTQVKDCSSHLHLRVNCSPSHVVACVRVRDGFLAQGGMDGTVYIVGYAWELAPWVCLHLGHNASCGLHLSSAEGQSWDLCITSSLWAKRTGWICKIHGDSRITFRPLHSGLSRVLP